VVVAPPDASDAAAVPAVLRGRAAVAAALTPAATHAVVALGRPPLNWLDGVADAARAAMGGRAGAAAKAAVTAAVRRLDAASEGLVAVWPARGGRVGSPAFVLACAGTPTCVAASAPRGTLIAAGTSHGSVELWDLHEPADAHAAPGCPQAVLAAASGVAAPVRLRSAATDVTLDRFDAPGSTWGRPLDASAPAPGARSRFPGHRTAVVAVSIVGRDAGRGAAGAAQVVSLDAAGVLLTWTVSQPPGGPCALLWASAADVCSSLPRPPSLYSPDTGIGGGGLALPGPDGGPSTPSAWASSLGDMGLASSTPLSLWEVGERVTAAHLSPGDDGSVLAGTADGTSAVTSRFGAPATGTPALTPDSAAVRAGPSWLRVPVSAGGAGPDADPDAKPSAAVPPSVPPLAPTPVTAVARSPLLPRAVLTAHADGTLRLFALPAASAAVRCWDDAAPPGHAVCSVAWSATRPSAFFTLDTAGVLRGWDLDASWAGPSAGASALREAGLRGKGGSGVLGLMRAAPARSDDPTLPEAHGDARPSLVTSSAAAARSCLLATLPDGRGAVVIPLTRQWSAPRDGEMRRMVQALA